MEPKVRKVLKLDKHKVKKVLNKKCVLINKAVFLTKQAAVSYFAAFFIKWQ